MRDDCFASPFGLRRLVPAGLLLVAALAGCRGHASPAATRPSEQAATPVEGDDTLPAVDFGELPACFEEGVPTPPPAGVRADTFTPPPRGTPVVNATPRPVPDFSALVAQSSFPLYAVGLPLTDYVPVAMQTTTYAAGAGRSVSGLLLQYRVPPATGGGQVLLFSAPAQGASPERRDADDALEAIRLDARRRGVSPASVLSDAQGALDRLACPQHESLAVVVRGMNVAADLETWQGAPQLQFLRFDSAGTEVTLETAALSRPVVQALPARLTVLASGQPITRSLQAVFMGQTSSAPLQVPSRPQTPPGPARIASGTPVPAARPRAGPTP